MDLQWNQRRTAVRERTDAWKACQKAASEGIVLLKNEGILPLKKDTAAALLGYGAEKTVKGGIGSGDVNNRKNISIYQGLKEAGVKIVSEDWISDYHNRYEQAREAWKEKVLEEAKKVDNPLMPMQRILLQCRWDVRWQRKISVKQMW